MPKFLVIGHSVVVIWLEIRNSLLEILLLYSGAVGKRSMRAEAVSVRNGGAHGSENVGISNKKLRKIRNHRKSKVSWATHVAPGLVGPKARPKGVVDG